MSLGTFDFDRWEELINGVDKTDIPIEFVNAIDITLKEPIDGQSTVNIDINVMRREGIGLARIDEIATSAINDLSSNIATINFYLDIPAIAKIIQHQTNAILINI